LGPKPLERSPLGYFAEGGRNRRAAGTKRREVWEKGIRLPGRLEGLGASRAGKAKIELPIGERIRR